MIRRRIQKAIPRYLEPLARRIYAAAAWDRWQTPSWSQEGEDRILFRLFERKTTGFYVDVGAHHPKRFSNTYLFYRRGWKGINIDAMPGSMALFKRMRPRDINLEVGVGVRTETLTYNMFSDPAFNGFSDNLSQTRDESVMSARLIGTQLVHVRLLSDILMEHIDVNAKIDFMSVDVEGLDLDVLSSNDWSRFRPTILLVEVLEDPWTLLGSSSIETFLDTQGYSPIAKCSNTVFFAEKHWIETSKKANE